MGASDNVGTGNIATGNIATSNVNISSTVKVLFVCLGNICRSPTAEAVFRSLVRDAGLDGLVEIDSCGTAGYHVGDSSDSRSQAAARGRGYDMSPLRGRQVQNSDFKTFDYILAMDNANLRDLQVRCPEPYQSKLGLFLTYASTHSEREVPDPYYGGEGGFAHVLDLVEDASSGLIEEIKNSL